jgi:hypothetical protein
MAAPGPAAMVTAVLKDRTSTITSALSGPPVACAPGCPHSNRTPAPGPPGRLTASAGSAHAEVGQLEGRVVVQAAGGDALAGAPFH